MKKITFFVATLILMTTYLNVHASESDDLSKRIGYFQIRHQIACRDYDTTDARCFWNKVEFVHAKEVVGRSDFSEYLTTDELARITKKIGFLESRYTKFCEEAEEPAKFCSALGKLVEKGNYFLENDQKYIPLGSDPLNEDYAEDVIENHCEEQWPDDFSMRAYCENEQEEGLNDLDKGKPSDISTSDFNTAREHCMEDWETDYSMWAYCENEQFEAIRELAEGKPSDISNEDFGTVRAKCKSDWTNDFTMRVYCEKQQYEGIRELSETSDNELDIQSISGSAYWTNWDADSEDDGFKIEPHFKNDNEELVYPDSKDWTAIIKIYNAEMDYSKYSDFDTHKLDLVNTINFSDNDVKYASILETPFVRVADEDLDGLSVGDGQFIIEAKFKSDTYGEFELSTEAFDRRDR